MSTAPSATERPVLAARVVVLALGALAAGTAAAPPVADEPVRTALMAACLVVATAAALGLGSAPAVRLALVVDPVFACFALGAHLGLNPAIATVAVCVVPLVVLLGADRRPQLRPAAPWLRRGSCGWDCLWLAAATVGTGAAALVVWALLFDPAPSPYLAGLDAWPLWIAVLGIIGFSLINPIWEEVLFRGALQTELGALFGFRIAIPLQSVAFGMAHLNGFPSGWLGVLMAFLWAIALGVLRHRTDGIVVPYLVHVSANVTIGVLAVFLLV